MKSTEYAEYIEKKLYEKGINIETQDYVIKYVYMNKKLFGNTLNIDKIVDRILYNLNHSIISIDTQNTPLQEMIRILYTRGSWNSCTHKISINPINKLKSILFSKEKQKNDSTIMHEIDHCATTEYIYISEQKKEQHIKSFLEKHEIVDPELKNEIKDFANEIYNKFDGAIAISGIRDYSQIIQNGIDLTRLNEGITAYKQEMYDKFLGNKSHTNYTIEKSVAKFIGDVIGTEKLISMHFNNNYEGIRSSFYEKTGKELNVLVKILNKKPKIKTILFKKMYTRSFYKKMENFIGDFSIKDKSHKINIDFISKFSIDYTKIGKDIYKSEKQECINNYRDSR